MKEDEDPADKMKGIITGISNFGIRHLQKGMNVKSRSGKPVMASFLVQRHKRNGLYQDEVLFKPTENLDQEQLQSESTDYWYRKSDIGSVIFIV